MTASLRTGAQIANESLELLRATQERLNHMKALFNSIKADYKGGQHMNTEELADLGSFLGYDWANHVDIQVCHMQKALDVVGAANE